MLRLKIDLLHYKAPYLTEFSSELLLSSRNTGAGTCSSLCLLSRQGLHASKINRKCLILYHLKGILEECDGSAGNISKKSYTNLKVEVLTSLTIKYT
jgi:hypothetical protein